MRSIDLIGYLIGVSVCLTMIFTMLAGFGQGEILVTFGTEKWVEAPLLVAGAIMLANRTREAI